MTAYTRPLGELRAPDAGEFGGKSANLGELLVAQIPIPPGFALDAGAYREFVHLTGLAGTIASALRHGEDDASKTIGEAMRFAPLPEEVRDELVAAYGAIGEPPVAVRSSALGEDSRDATFAGQQESFLWVRGFEHLCDAVRDCWASLYTPRAIAYRRRLNMTDTAMGVTVQEMVDAEVSGVLFTCNPVSGDPSMVAVNASWGLGIAVVGGETTPDDYLISKITGEVVRQTISSKEIEYVPEAAGRGTVRREVPPERRDRPCLEPDRLAALVELGRRVEKHFGSLQDVEWAIDRDGSPFVLQARPVTATAKTTSRLSGSALSRVMSTFGVPEKD